MQPTDTPSISPDVVLREEFDDWTILFQQQISLLRLLLEYHQN